MSGEEYIALLCERRAEYMRQRVEAGPITGDWSPPPPIEYFVRPGDVDLFTPPSCAGIEVEG